MTRVDNAVILHKNYLAMISVLFLAAIIYFIFKLFTKNNDGAKNNPVEDNQNEDKTPKKKEKKSWFERHLWAIALFMGIFLMRMCSDLASH